MDDDLVPVSTLNRSTFMFVMTELQHKFREKSLDASFDECSSTSSGFGSVSSSWSCSLPEFCSDTISPKPQYTVDLIPGPICEDTLRQALRNLRPLPNLGSVKEYIQAVDFKDVSKDEHKLDFTDTPTPCPENINGWQSESYLNRGQLRYNNYIDLDTDMTGRFIVELKPRKKKRGLLSRLRFWKKQCKLSKDVGGSTKINEDQKKSRSLFCCF